MREKLKSLLEKECQTYYLQARLPKILAERVNKIRKANKWSWPILLKIAFEMFLDEALVKEYVTRKNK